MLYLKSRKHERTKKMLNIKNELSKLEIRDEVDEYLQEEAWLSEEEEYKKELSEVEDGLEYEYIELSEEELHDEYMWGE